MKANEMPEKNQNPQETREAEKTVKTENPEKSEKTEKSAKSKKTKKSAKTDKKSKSNANIGFEKQLWNAACVLWGHIPAAEYRQVIIGLIFLRYISSAYEKKRQELIEEGYGLENQDYAYTAQNIFIVPEDARWSKIAQASHTPEIGMILDNAMEAVEKKNATLKNVLPKNFANPELDKKVLGQVVDIFTNNIDMSDTDNNEDLLGRTYEYCIAQFAEKEGKGGGEFYTPASIVKTLVEILQPFDNCRVYDPCCGSGGMFVQSAKFIEKHSGNSKTVSVYGQEANADTWKMAKINMAIRGIEADFGPHHADTFTNDLHKGLQADFILANPPFNYHPWNRDQVAGETEKNNGRWKYGLPPANNANYAWIQHMIHSPLEQHRANRTGAGKRSALHAVQRRGRNPQKNHRGRFD